jgi:hypothetical protein
MIEGGLYQYCRGLELVVLGSNHLPALVITGSLLGCPSPLDCRLGGCAECDVKAQPDVLSA